MKLINREEVAKKLGMSIHTIRAWTTAGCPSVRVVDKKPMYNFNEVLNWKMEQIKSKNG